MADKPQLHEMAASLKQELEKLRSEIDLLREKESDLAKRLRALQDTIRSERYSDLEGGGTADPRIAR